MNLRLAAFLFLSISILSCDGKKEKHDVKTTDKNELQEISSPTVNITHASKFKVEYTNGLNVVTVMNPWQGASQNYLYVLVREGQTAPDLQKFRKNENDIIQAVEIPIKRIALTSTTFVPLLDRLNETESFVAFPGTDHISSSKARELIEAGKVANIGTENGINIERLIELNPDALMENAMQGESDDALLARKAGIPVLFNADYLEKTPLGRAEWIKFAGLFYDKNHLADSIFNQLTTVYDSLKLLASKATYKPTVFSGIVYGDTWFMPGGENSGAIFIRDAHGQYLWKETPNEGSIKLSFEAVYDKAHSADYWIGVASFSSLDEIKRSDKRYAKFKAFKQANVYSYNAKRGEKGGMTFFELGYARPDLILADIIKILHPELLPGYQLYFYKKLQ